MGQHAIRFGVEKNGLRSGTYKVWNNGVHDDVYILSRQVGFALKASLHETGKWHFKTTRPGPPPKLLSQESWQRPAPMASHVTRAFSIVIPKSAARKPRPAQDVQWYTLPEAAAVAEFTVFLSPPDLHSEGHPGARAARTILVGKFRLPVRGEMVWVVVRSLDESPRPSPPVGARVRSFSMGSDGSSVLQQLESVPGDSLVALLSGIAPEGYGWLMEVPAKYESGLLTLDPEPRPAESDSTAAS